MDLKSDKEFIHCDFCPLLNYNYEMKPKRQSNMVAAYRLFSVVVIVGFVVGLYWRLV